MNTPVCSQFTSIQASDTRATILNGELKDHFERWYPGLKIEDGNAGIVEELKEAA